MKLKRFKFHSIYQSTILLLLTVSLSVSIVFFWSKGFLNFENVTSIFEADITSQALQKRNDIKNIKVLLEQNKIRSSVKTIEKFNADVSKISKLTKRDEKYYALDKRIKDSSKTLNELISLPELSSVLLVLKNKLIGLESFVVSNKWKTLSRISKRLNARVFPKKRQKTSLKKIPKLIRLTKSHLNKMVAITKASKLKKEIKESIYSKIAGLNTEIEMLKKYLKKQSILKKSITRLEVSFSSWIKSLGINISYKKIQYEARIKYLFVSLTIMVIFLFISWLIGIWINKIGLKKDTKNLEEFVIDLAKEKLVYQKKGLIGGLSSGFNEELERVQNYLEKRINLGLTFQETLPFPAILLDANLLMVWANNLFYKEWGIISDTKNKNLTWDYLQSFTNLGDDDPVLIAANKDMAGIYQIQIRPEENPDSTPYEMFVNPIGSGENKHIMIYFYPLKSLQDTLVEQTKSIVGPINRSLEALASNRFNGKVLKSIEKDFNVASMDEIFSKFKDLDQKISTQRDDLLKEMQNIEQGLNDEIKIKNDIHSLVGENLKIQNKGNKKISEIKNNIISNVENRGEAEKFIQDLMSLLKDFLKKTEIMYSSLEDSNNLVNENRKVLSKLLELRPMIKGIKTGGADELNHLMIGIDVIISKLEITLSGHQLEGMNDYKENIIVIKNTLNKMSSNFINLVNKMNEGDDKIVNAIKDFYQFQKEMELVTKKAENIFVEIKSESTQTIS